MTEKLISGSKTVWPEITRAMRKVKRPSYIAIAYLGKGAGRLLPLKPDSRLVVDASEESVRGGRTYPKELLTLLLRQGVRIFSVGNLHAKVIVTESMVFVGSANASRNSAENLNEAVIVSSSRLAVAAARRYVKGLCLDELGPEELRRLQGIYRPPRTFAHVGGYRRASGAGKLPRLRVEQLRYKNTPDGSEEAQETGERTAKRKMELPRRHQLQDFWLSGAHTVYRPGDQVVQVVEDSKGRKWVESLGKVLYLKRWRRRHKRAIFIYVECAKARRTQVARMAKKVGYGGLRALEKNGWVTGKLRERIQLVMAG